MNITKIPLGIFPNPTRTITRMLEAVPGTDSDSSSSEHPTAEDWEELQH
jgi:hypothetical protein